MKTRIFAIAFAAALIVAGATGPSWAQDSDDDDDDQSSVEVAVLDLDADDSSGFLDSGFLGL